MCNLKERIKNMVPLFILRWIAAPKLMGCYYHLVADEKLPHVQNLIKYKNVAQFEEDMIFLSKKFRFISYDDFLCGNYKKQKSLILTFDDGYKELFTMVYPILKKYNIPAIFFISTNLIDNASLFYRNGISLLIDKLSNLDNSDWGKIFQQKIENHQHQSFPDINSFILFLKSVHFKDREILHFYYELFEINVADFLQNKQPYLSTSEIKELNNETLITIGAHTLDHSELFMEKDTTEIKRQIVESAKRIISITGKKVVPFAFPFTSHGVSRKIISEIQAENTAIRGFFGEAVISKKDTQVIARFAFDNPDLRIDNSIKMVYIEYLKSAIK